MERFYKMVEASNRRFPEGVNPFQMATRLLEECGEIASEVWGIDGMQLCEYCWENRVHECVACDREHYDENMRPIFVIPRLSAEMEESYRKDWIENGHYWSCGFAQTKADLETAEYNFFNDDSPNGWICDDDRCFEKFIEDFNNKYPYKVKLTSFYPAIVVFEDGEIINLLQGKLDEKLTIVKTKQFIEIHKIGE